MATNRSFLDKIVEELIKSKRVNYSEDCISYYIDENKFIIEDLPNLYNHRQEKLKGTLIRHRKAGKNGNQKCVVYLHGLGSSRLESLAIAQYLPDNYCICMFDLSGSGKSDGNYLTYGLKQQEDIDPVIGYLNKNKFIKEFIIWGRSMGAVATLLYANKKLSGKTEQRRRIFESSSMKGSVISHKSSGEDESLVVAVVLDSPFHNYRDIAREIAVKKLSVPGFLTDIALNYVEESFGRILRQSLGEKYNPFNIKFDQEIKLKVPIVFLYSEKDEIIPPAQCESIIRNIKSKFEKTLINDCTHNQARPEKIIDEIFNKLEIYTRRKNNEEKKHSESLSKDLLMSYSCERKRGIFVYTSSKEKELKSTIENDRISLKNIRQTMDLETIKTQHVYTRSPKSTTSLLSKNPVNLRSSGRSKLKKTYNLETIEQQIRDLQMNTMDLETNKLISQKLLDIKSETSSFSRILRSKRMNVERKRDIRLTHHKYLE